MGKRVCAFLKYKETMNSVRYVATLRKALKLLREDGLTLLHDRSKVHTSKMTTIFLQREKVKSKVIPGNSPDVMPIGNLFFKNQADPRQQTDQDNQAAQERGDEGMEGAE